MNILGISGSIRKHSYNTSLLKAAADYLPSEAHFQLADISVIPHYNEDEDNDQKPAAVVDFIAAIDETSLILFASPEYNHSIPGVLKNAIDWASRPAFESVLKHKKCGLLSASMSPVGGARAQADLKNVLQSTLSIIYPSTECSIPSAQNKFNDQGQLTDEDSKRHVQKYLDGIIDWVNAT